MSSIYVAICETTPFGVVNGRKSADAISDLIFDYMDGYPVRLEHVGDHRYQIELDGTDVGHSFPERLRDFIAAIQPHVTDAFVVQLREETMRDENDEEMFGGPDNASIAAFRKNYYQERAIDIMKSESPELAALLRAALNGELVRPADISCVTVMQGGVLQSIVTSHPIINVAINYDDDEDTRDQEVDIPQNDGSTAKGLISIARADINPNWCAKITDLAFESEARQSDRPRQSA